ncbi:hypothetical protein QJS10_CPB12g00338 [Acorus calamus]|uniref:Uncharacterized protein n=1 Tax=Acorus calamus TaxID=4465 RepID=A0AAV9DMM6_ACOCL|nr:hypothetical protein QJS10_CPB12g00338 [Acorus calamus]
MVGVTGGGRGAPWGMWETVGGHDRSCLGARSAQWGLVEFFKFECYLCCFNMVVNALINAPPCKTGLSQHSLSRFIENEYYARFISRKPSRQRFCIHASSVNSGTEQNLSAPLKGKSPLALVLDIPRTDFVESNFASAQQFWIRE